MKLTIKKKAQASLKYWVGEYEERGFPLDVSSGLLACDTETTGLDAWGEVGVDREITPARLFMVTFCNEDGQTALIRFRVDAFTREVELDPRGLKLLQKYLEDKSTAKIFFNAPFDLRMLRFAGVIVRGEILDALLGFHMMKPDELSKKLKSVSKRYLGIEDDDQKALDKSVQSVRLQVQYARKRVASGKPKDGDALRASILINPKDEQYAYKADMWLGDPDLCGTYAERDALRTMTLWLTAVAAFDTDAEEGGRLWENFRDEQRCQQVVIQMQDRGICTDVETTESVFSWYDSEMNRWLSKIRKIAGAEFNPAALEDRQRAFFVERGFKPLKYKKKKGSQDFTKHSLCKGRGCDMCQNTGMSPQLDADFLYAIGARKVELEDGSERVEPKDELAYNILHWSACHTMREMVGGYREARCLESGVWVVHPNLKQTGTGTNRFSAENPNLQNVADDDSAKKRSNIPYRPRECFTPRPGHVMMLPDYSQIEVWVLAIRAKAKALMTILQMGGDTHGRIAGMVWRGQFDLDAALKAKKVDADKLSKGELSNLKIYTNRRKRSKNLQFCKIYGGGPGRIAEMIGDGCTVEEAKRFIAEYDEALPEVAAFMREKVGMAKATGIVENGFGWRYPINPKLAYRAVNYDIQGTAACIMKRAMNRVGDLCDGKWAGKMWSLLTIHDELMLEALKEAHDKVMMADVVVAMQADWKFLGAPCPFPVGMKMTETRWNEAVEVKL